MYRKYKARIADAAASITVQKDGTIHTKSNDPEFDAWVMERISVFAQLAGESDIVILGSWGDLDGKFDIPYFRVMSVLHGTYMYSKPEAIDILLNPIFSRDSALDDVIVVPWAPRDSDLIDHFSNDVFGLDVPVTRYVYMIPERTLATVWLEEMASGAPKELEVI